MSEAWTGLTWDDLDQLADYAAGALTGAESERIAALIQTDERWAAAHAELVAAEPLVRAALHSAAETPVSMPDDVASRIEAALADTRLDRSDQSARSSQSGRSGRAARSGRPDRPHPVRPGSRSRRRSPVLARVAAGVLAVAVLSGVGAVARTVLSEAGGVPMMAAEDADPDPGQEGPVSEPAAAPPVTDSAARPLVQASGTDYSLDSLPALADLAEQAQVEATRSQDSAIGEFGKLTVAPTLSDLATPGGLDRCLAEVGRRHPGEIAVVDFAQFEGEPALVIVVRQSTSSTVVAVGSECGTAGADELAAVRGR